MTEGISIFIVEDEAITAESLADYIRKRGYDVSGISDDPEEAFATISIRKPDLVFLDINLEQEKDGIWLAEQIKARLDIPFIFLTSYSDPNTVYKAARTQPNGYLIKPFSETQIFTAIEVAVNNYTEEIPKLAEEQPQDKETFFVKDKDLFTKIQTADIEYLEADDSYVTLYTANRRFAIRNSMSNLVSQISNSNLILTSRSYCVNITKVDSIGPGFVQIGDKQIPLSRSMRNEVMDKLNFLSGR